METAETFFPQPAVDAALVRLTPRKTIAFATFILYEMVNVFNCRSERHSLLKVGIFSNKWLILGVLGSLLLMVFAIQIPFTGAFFHTTPLTIHDWSVALATSIIIFVAVEIWKALNLWREKRRKDILQHAPNIQEIREQFHHLLNIRSTFQ